jgi:clan AA aspartic protease
MAMGLTYSNLKLTNLFNGKTVRIRALVGTGALHLCIPERVATELGFDVTEVGTVRVTVADSRRIEAPRVSPVQIDFSNRSTVMEAWVMGDEPLLGVIPIEAMDCIVDATTQELRVNPAHPDFAVYRV